MYPSHRSASFSSAYQLGRKDVESNWNVMAHGEARGEWRGNWRMEWVASTLHTTSEHGVSSITTADAHTSAASSRLNWRPRRFKRTRPFRRKTKAGFCACAITFQTQSTCPPHAMLTSAFSLLLQIFGSPSTPILENPEYQTRWYFKYFLGKREYLYVFYQNMGGEPMSRMPKVLDEKNSLFTHSNLMRRHNFIL